jgi:methylase of polypeptide subunit release factors
VEDELNRYLATDYGMRPTDTEAYTKWLSSHRPFHWFVDFYGIMNKGGFDAIIGNPPYVEYKEVKETYRVKGFATEECENLFAFFYERCVALGNKSARIGMIIPVASVCTDAYAVLQKIWMASGNLIVSNFNDRPGKLFEGLEHIRLAIVLLSKSALEKRGVHTTRYNKWNTEARSFLFQILRFTDVTTRLRNEAIPKLGTELELDILSRTASQKKYLENFVSKTSPHQIYYTRKLSGFVQILNFIPSILDSRGRKREPSELKSIPLATKQHRDVFLALLNSSLFYWFLTVWSDCRNLNRREVYGLPFDLDKAINEIRSRLIELSSKLTADFRKNAKVLEMNYEKWGRMRIECIYPKYSKSIIDEIDSALADHYGFTDEETDFIINYDIKYRMGLGGEDAEE